MLALDRQNHYRRRYQATHPEWHNADTLYAMCVHQAVARYQHTHHVPVVLDVGCGAGGVLEHLSASTLVPCGIDQDIASLRRHRNPRLHRVVGTIEHLPFPSQSFDLVISAWVLEHVLHPAQLFAEIARVLKPQGMFIFLTPNAYNLVTVINRLIPRAAQRTLVRWLYGRAADDTFPVVYRANSQPQLAALTHGCGLEQIRLHLVRDPTYVAFNDWLFHASVLLDSYTPVDYAVHIVGEYRKGASQHPSESTAQHGVASERLDRGDFAIQKL